MVEGISPNEAMERLRRFEEEQYVKRKFHQVY
jgi:DNA-binding Lrp family transcriptional regulator